MTFIKADAEQAKATGGMLALGIDPAYAELLTVPNGEPIDDLHLTLAYFGQDVTDLSSYMACQIAADIALYTGPLSCRAFGHATFNPDVNPCAVYLIGDSKELAELHRDLEREVFAHYDMTDAHAPFAAHVTAGYELEAADLDYVGDVVFDRIVCEWAGESHTWML